MKRSSFKRQMRPKSEPNADRVSAFAATELGVSFPASFDQWERMQVDPDTGEIIGGIHQ